MSSRYRLDNWRMLCGSTCIFLQPRNDRNAKRCNAPMLSGNATNEVHLVRFKSSKFCKWQIEFGSWTRFRHFIKESSTKLEHEPIDSGSLVIDLHSFMESIVNFLSWPIDEGIDLRLLHLSNTNSSRLSIFPRLSGRTCRTLLWWPDAPPKTSRFKLRKQSKYRTNASVLDW